MGVAFGANFRRFRPAC